jgi:glutamate/tyrosine decarboxylase-like PLP-dependent enzyme
MANFMAMALARDVHLARLVGAGRPPRGEMLEGVRVYTSDQTHFSIARALDLLGFPPETLVVVEADESFHLRAAPVTAAVIRDRAAGLVPFAIAAVAGSTNTGSVDAVGELADVADAQDLWLHVDAAYGGAARLSTRDAGRVPDLERADSVTVDPHKWFFQAYDIGGLLVRDGTLLAQVFGGRAPEYYRGGETPALGGEIPDAIAEGHDAHDDPAQLNFYKLSFEGTRRWRALKLWMSWKHLGTAGFGHLIELTDDLAAYLARRCAEADDFERAAQAGLATMHDGFVRLARVGPVHRQFACRGPLGRDPRPQELPLPALAQLELSHRNLVGAQVRRPEPHERQE